ncbi:polysaccharide pyruvyl transferase family protein (plasmid) [Pseudomonas silesiensis]|uniref:polysaccharide pyruvyl transferase family protein n=1 Tax=Pseudomonas silesiensis TaxID=1853130 RepID=UPI0030CCA700
MKPINLYWCRGRGRSDQNQQNFGDYLSAQLVEIFSGREVVYAPIDKAEMIAVGSVLGREKKAKQWGFPRRLHIWGTGSGNSDDVFSGRHHYHAVRGLKCKGQIQGLKTQPVVGDPGLLSPWVINKPSGKKISVGLIPHFSHHNTPEIAALLSAIPNSRIINVFSPVKQVLEEIASCDFVLSSSLHGLIVADSYHVPNMWLTLQRDPAWEFKFKDYYSSFGLFDREPVTAQEIYSGPAWSVEPYMADYHRPGLEAMQHGLISAFPSF